MTSLSLCLFASITIDCYLIRNYSSALSATSNSLSLNCSGSRFMKIVLIGGTPGTGKTAVAEILRKRLKRKVVNLGQIALDGNCIREHDDERQTQVIDEDCLVFAVEEYLEEADSDLVIEGHYIDLVPSRPVEKVFVLRTHPDTLMKRLTERNWDTSKVRENVEAEVFGVCQLDAIDAFGEEKVYEIDTTDKSAEETANKILQRLISKKKPSRIDWMTQLEDEGKLDDYVLDM